jgi:hypothetical protein
VVHCTAGCEDSALDDAVVKSLLREYHRDMGDGLDIDLDTLSSSQRAERFAALVRQVSLQLEPLHARTDGSPTLPGRMVAFTLQTHGWAHARSCFKKGPVCRYGFPSQDERRGGSTAPYVADDGKVVCPVDAVDAWTNPFSPYLTALTHANNDITLTLGSGSTGALLAQYCAGYATKRQG